MALVVVGSSSSSRSTNAMLEESIADVAALVDAWRSNDDEPFSLFLHGGVVEARRFMTAAVELHRAMLLLAADVDDILERGERLVRAQEVLESAMVRLQLELGILLSAIEDDDDVIDHIRLVAEAMMGAGYGMECVTTFKSHRRAEFAAAVRRLLGYSPSQHATFHKLAWDDVGGKVRTWHTAAGFAFNFAFSGERALCRRVFAADVAVADRVFEGIAVDHAADLLAVAESAVARARRHAPERLFHVLDVHATLVEILPAIVSVLGEKSDAALRATAALRNAGEAARGILVGFEEAIQKATSSSKTTAAATGGGAVHPLTRYVMNYLILLADYDDTLARIYQQSRISGDASPEYSPSSNPISRLLSVLLRKLDGMAGRHRSPAMRSLFMANNTHYVGKKVRGSGKLEGIVVGGEDWSTEEETRRHVDAFVHLAWRGVLVVGGEGADGAVREAVAAHRRWVVADDELGDVMRNAVAAAVVPAYRALYRRHGTAAWMTPGDVSAAIARLFGGARVAVEGATWPTPRHHRLRLTSSSSLDKLAHRP